VAGDYLQDPAALYPGVGTSVRLTELPFASDVDLSGYQGFGRTTFAENNTCVWYSRTSGLHNGLDFDIPYGTELRWHSDQDASVVSTDGQPYGAGPHSVVLSSGGFVFIYGHTSDTDSPLAVGDTVHDGDLIGYSGNPSGTSTGGNDHLHFETRPADNTSVAVNPMGFFPQDTQDTISAATAADYPVGESATSLGYYTMGLDPSCITPTPTPAP
jgi:murein DD-endopeptidase MepM/ murein hydrolase activator NlpD